MSDQPIDFTQRNIAIDILRAVTMCVMIFESVHQIKNLNIKTYRYMKKIIGLFLLIWAIGSAQVSAQSETNRLDSIMPVRGLAIAAPSAQKLDLFLKFVQEELAPSHFNLLILRVDWNYAYESHPELRDPTPLTRSVSCLSSGIVGITEYVSLPRSISWVINHGLRLPTLYYVSIRSSTRRHTWIPRTIRVGPTQTDFIVKVTARFIRKYIKSYSL